MLHRESFRATLLLFAGELFGLEPLLAGCFRWAGFLAPLRANERSLEHAAESFDRGFLVAELAAKFLAANMKIAFGIELGGKASQKPGTVGFGHGWRTGEVERELGLGRGLIDVLATRSAGSRECDAEFFQRNSEMRCNFQIGWFFRHNLAQPAGRGGSSIQRYRDVQYSFCSEGTF